MDILDISMTGNLHRIIIFVPFSDTYAKKNIYFQHWNAFLIDIIVASSKRLSLRSWDRQFKWRASGRALQCLTGKAVRGIRKVSNFALWRETQKDDARAEPGYEKTTQSNNS